MSPITPSEVAAAGGRNLPHKIANVIRHRIDAGKLQTGNTMPAERELAAQAGCSRQMAREAYDLLARDGLVIRRPGHPSKVRVPPPVRLVDESRYSEELARAKAGKTEPGRTALCRDYGCTWGEVSVIADIQREAATEPHAMALGLGAGADVLYRRMIEHVRGVPVRIHESRIAVSVFGEGSPITDPKQYPWPGGTVALLWSLGYAVRGVLSELDAARPPTPREAADLMIPAGQAVSALSRRFLVGEGGADAWVPIEASTIITPATGYRLRWATTV